MSTTTTDLLETQLRNKLLDFVPLSGATLRARLGGGNGRLWKDGAPDNAAYPFGVMRLINRLSRGEYNSERETFDLELMLYGRPRTNAAAVEDAADVADQAMLRYKDASGGALTFSRARQRDTLPAFADPADREVVQVRLVYGLVVWSVLFTQYSTS